MPVPVHQIRATFSADTITVYQAYPREIAEAAVAATHAATGGPDAPVVQGV